MSCKTGKGLFGEVQGNNDGRDLDRCTIAFQNVYFDLVDLRFIQLRQFSNSGKFAVFNQTDKAVPANLILDEVSLKRDDFFTEYKHMIPIFASCLGQNERVTKVLLADVLSGFIPRGLHDFYQKGAFILGPGGRGKSEFHKILRLLHGKFNTITPCQNTLGQKFSHGQYAGSLKTAFLPDEIHRDCGLSQQMWYNWVDQTNMQCELKFKQKLKNLPFLMCVWWVANFFFPNFQLSEALLRRAVVYDVNFFDFVKFQQTPSNLVERNEVRSASCQLSPFNISSSFLFSILAANSAQVVPALFAFTFLP